MHSLTRFICYRNLLEFASTIVARMLSGEATLDELDQGLSETCLLDRFVSIHSLTPAASRLARPVFVQHLAHLKPVTLYFYPLESDDIE